MLLLKCNGNIYQGQKFIFSENMANPSSSPVVIVYCAVLEQNDSFHKKYIYIYNLLLSFFRKLLLP